MQWGVKCLLIGDLLYTCVLIGRYFHSSCTVSHIHVREQPKVRHISPASLFKVMTPASTHTELQACHLNSSVSSVFMSAVLLNSSGVFFLSVIGDQNKAVVSVLFFY